MEAEEKECFKKFLREYISRKLRERGLKVEDFSGEFKISMTPSFVLKSGGVSLGYVFIVVDDQDIEKVEELRKFEEQSYIVVEKGIEKRVASLLIDLGLAGRVRFIPWELRVYF